MTVLPDRTAFAVKSILLTGSVATLVTFLIGVPELKTISAAGAAWLLLPYGLYFVCTRWIDTTQETLTTYTLTTASYVAVYSQEHQGFVGGATITVVSFIHVATAAIILLIVTVRQFSRRKPIE